VTSIPGAGRLRDPDRFRLSDPRERLALEEQSRRLHKGGQRFVWSSDPCPGVASAHTTFGCKLPDQRAQTSRGHNTDALPRECFTIHSDGHQHGDEPSAMAAGVIQLEVSDIAKHLIEVGWFWFDTILEFDDEDSAILEDDEVWASPTRAGKLELKHESEPRGLGEAPRQFVA